MTDDEKLIWKIKHLSGGDAKDKLVRKYYDQIYAYVYRHVLNVDDSLDLTQEIFIKAINALSGYDKKKSSFKTWLYTIATNKMTDWYRTQHFTEELSDALPEKGNFEDVVANRALAREILNFIKNYDYVSYQIIELKFFSDLTFSDIAEMLSVPLSTVKTKYYKAIDNCRKEFANDRCKVSR